MRQGSMGMLSGGGVDRDSNEGKKVGCFCPSRLPLHIFLPRSLLTNEIQQKTHDLPRQKSDLIPYGL